MSTTVPILSNNISFGTPPVCLNADIKHSNLNHPSWRLEKNERNGKIKQGVRI
jgi:hypothetical protein